MRFFQLLDANTDKSFSIWSIEYYQQFFNVDTMMVVDRIATSMIPKRAPGNYLRSHIGLNPDLYGPFWIIMTLVSLIIKPSFPVDEPSNLHASLDMNVGEFENGDNPYVSILAK